MPKGLITTIYSTMHQNFIINIVLTCTNFPFILGAIFQFTHDLSHKFIIDLLITCHFSFISSINLPKICANHVLVNNYYVQICRCLHSVLMYNSSFMCYLGNTLEIINNKKRYTLILK